MFGMHMGLMIVCVTVSLCLVAVFNIDVSWPLFVAEGNREYERRLSFIYHSGLPFYYLPLFVAIYLAHHFPQSPYCLHSHTLPAADGEHLRFCVNYSNTLSFATEYLMVQIQC